MFHFNTCRGIPDSIWNALSLNIDAITEKSWEILPLVVLFKMIYDFTVYAGTEHITIKTHIRTLLKTFMIAFFLVFYKNFLMVVDDVIGFFSSLDVDYNEALAAIRKKNMEELNDLSFAKKIIKIPALVLGKTISGWTYFISFATHQGSIVFMDCVKSTIIVILSHLGPIAAVISILPGPFSNSLSTWLRNFVSIFAWSITLSVLQKIINAVNDSLHVSNKFTDNLFIIPASIALLICIFLTPMWTSMFLVNSVSTGVMAAASWSAANVGRGTLQTGKVVKKGAEKVLGLLTKKFFTVVIIFTCIASNSALATNTLAEKAGIDNLLETEDESFFSKVRTKVTAALSKVPVVGKFFSDTKDQKLNKIYKRQNRSIGAIRKIAHDAIDTKSRVEDIFYFKKQSIDTAQDIFESFKQAKAKKLLAVFAENALEIPVNPAEYIPQVNESTRKLSKNLELDLSLEKSFLRNSKFFLEDTKRDIIHHLSYKKSRPIDHGYGLKQLQEAEDYENDLQKAIQAKKLARVKLYTSEVEQIRADIKNLRQIEKNNKHKLTAGEMLQLQFLIDKKQERCHQLNEKIDQLLEDSLELTDKEKEEMAIYTTEANIRSWLEQMTKKRNKK